jgi:hypothetical protein
MKKVHKRYRIAVIISAIVSLTLLAIFSFMMMGAEPGTENRKIYQTLLTYSVYLGIAAVTVIGGIWFFRAPKKSVGYRRTEAEMIRKSKA